MQKEIWYKLKVQCTATWEKVLWAEWSTKHNWSIRRASSKVAELEASTLSPYFKWTPCWVGKLSLVPTTQPLFFLTILGAVSYLLGPLLCLSLITPFTLEWNLFPSLFGNKLKLCQFGLLLGYEKGLREREREREREFCMFWVGWRNQ
jgi:hypothetical protein